MSDPAVLLDAEFDPRVKRYWVWSPVLLFTCLIVTIPIAVLYFVVASIFIDRYLANLSCTLTERTLDIRKGILNKTESTIPLEKITDLQLFQGPVMRFFGLHGFKVETAGQSAGPGSSLVNIVGIVDTKGFRRAVLAQRDRLHDREGGVSVRVGMASGIGAEPGGYGGEGLAEAVALLREIRDTLSRLETKLKAPHDP